MRLHAQLSSGPDSAYLALLITAPLISPVASSAPADQAAGQGPVSKSQAGSRAPASRLAALPSPPIVEPWALPPPPCQPGAGCPLPDQPGTSRQTLAATAPAAAASGAAGSAEQARVQQR